MAQPPRHQTRHAQYATLVGGQHKRPAVVAISETKVPAESSAPALSATNP
ncbi:MAG: hypothetical protein ACI841_004362 [Planctomycetota bacterium]|jgi:hypothetical protein